jgi:hypothetical protein
LDNKNDSVEVFDLVAEMIEVIFKVPSMKKEFSAKIKKFEKYQNIVQIISYEIN